MPSLSEMQEAQQKEAEQATASATGSAAGSDAMASSGIVGMLGMFGGGTQDIDAAQGGAVIQMIYGQIQDVLKVSVRKVTLTVKWKVLGRDRDMKVVAFFTDPAAMDKVLSGMGSEEYDPNRTSTPTGPSQPSQPSGPSAHGRATATPTAVR